MTVSLHGGRTTSNPLPSSSTGFNNDVCVCICARSFECPENSVIHKLGSAEIAFAPKPYWPIATVNVLDAAGSKTFSIPGWIAQPGEKKKIFLPSHCRLVTSESGIEAILVKFPSGFKSTWLFVFFFFSFFWLPVSKTIARKRAQLRSVGQKTESKSQYKTGTLIC